MLKKLLALLFVYVIVLNIYGCALNSGSIAETQKEPKLIFNASYVQALVMVQGALKPEPLQFEKAIIAKDTAQLKGNYADGKAVQIVISKISDSQSSLVVRGGTSQADKENAGKIIATIMQYSKQKK